MGCLFPNVEIEFLNIFWYKSFIRYAFGKDFLQICGLSFHSLNSGFYKAEVFNFNDVQHIGYLFYGSFFWPYILKVVANPMVIYIFFYVIFWETFFCIIHIDPCVISLKLILAKCVRSVSNFIFLHMDVQSFNTICWKDNTSRLSLMFHWYICLFFTCNTSSWLL